MSFRTEVMGIRWRYLFVAFVASLVLWYTVNARDKVERVVEVRIDYKGLPSGLVVTDGLLNKLTVRLRGPVELLRSMLNRDVAHTVDLSGVTKGSNVIPLISSQLPDLRAYEVLEVTPSRLMLQVDQIVEVKLPVKAGLRASPLSSSLRLKNIEVTPGEVTAKGAAAVLADLHEVTVEIPADLEGEGKTVVGDLPVLAPPAVEIVPPIVQVSRQVEVRRRRLSLQRDVIPDDESADITIRPSRVSLLVSVPQGMARDTGYLSQFQVMVVSDDGKAESMKGENGKWQVALEVATPVGGTVLKVSPSSVELTRNKPD